MKTDDLREAFLKFFESKGSVRRQSDLLVPKGDPTVLFTPAGMNQFKEQFLGLGKLGFTRATTCQKCLRTGDIENVGKTAYHHTFFEMLGNFSFGDYFKREAIQWAWEFLLKSVDAGGLALDPKRLSVSVYLDDDEAYNIWHDEVRPRPTKIERMGEDDNFWPAGAPSKGPDGVCGPCSEIFFHPEDGTKEVEIWNLVFTQFNRSGPPPKNLHPLPKKNIDTGMGLERTASVLQGVDSNFHIDIFQPLLNAIGEIVSKRYDPRSPEAVHIRRIADHARGVTFCIHENVLPSREKQGYVVRRLIRRAVLDGHRLGMQEPFFYRLASVVAQAMQVPYPELAHTVKRVADVVRQEEEQFLSTLETGIGYFSTAVKSAQAGTVTGDDAFKLHATYGFPIEIVESLAAERNLRVDRRRYDELWQEHVKVSGRGAFAEAVFVSGPIDVLKKTMHGTEFLGYQTTEAQAEVKGIIAQNELVEDLVEVGHEKPVALVLDRTPFYGEAGGQVGDTGVIEGTGGAGRAPRFRFQVQDTKREGEFIVHLGHLTEGEIRLGDKVVAKVDAERRAGIRRAHSATHLLHHALRELLGPHAVQAGSKVDRDYLRFDFTHPQAVSPAELQKLEDRINARIMQCAPVRWDYKPLEEAKKSGAMALFGEKYPDIARVVSIGEYSKELCGGTHLDNTGEVGLCKITREESVAAGTRRIEALTGPAALEFVRHEEQSLREVSHLLKVPPSDVLRRVESLVEEVRALKKQASHQRSASAGASLDDLLKSATEVGGVRIVACELAGSSPDEMRQQIDLLRRKASPIAVLLAAKADGTVQLVSGLSKELVERGLDAVAWVKDVAKVVGGGGGGRPDMAQAGGKKPEKLAEALQHGLEYMRQRLMG